MATPLKVKKIDNCDGKPRIKDLDYNTYVTDVPSGRNCIYVKVKKRSRPTGPCGKSQRALWMNWKDGSCVLMNTTYGTLRQLPGDTLVTPLKAVLEVSELPPHCYNTVKKGYNDC